MIRDSVKYCLQLVLLRRQSRWVSLLCYLLVLKASRSKQSALAYKLGILVTALVAAFVLRVLRFVSFLFMDSILTYLLWERA